MFQFDARGLLPTRRVAAFVCASCIFASVGSSARASEAPDSAPKAEGEQTSAPPAKSSPWLLMPTFSSNPKLGTSVGGMAGYVLKFDPKSQVSLFAVSAQYTSTDSATAAAIGRASWGEDHHRIMAGLFGGRIKNDYDDYLGTGEPLKSEDNLHSVFLRYLHRVTGDWFLGVQAVATSYQIFGQTALDEDILDTLGLTGFESAGAGVAIYHDSRDVQDAPTRGWMLNGNNIVYRESLAGDFNFEVYRLEYRGFWSHGDGHVFALRQSNQWTVDAPPSAYAPVRLRGYTGGEYLGQNMSAVEVEERYRLATRWTATVFAGVACLYGAGLKCDDSGNIYPSVGAGVQYLLKPDKGLVANLEFAQAEDGNNAVLVQLGYAW